MSRGLVEALRYQAGFPGEWLCGLAADEIERLRRMVDFWDHFYDEAFPDDPYLSGAMRGEVERLRAALNEGDRP